MSPSPSHADLLAQWLSNEAELQRLRDLPVGGKDPAMRERELDEIQDEIEWAVGVEWGRRSGMPTDA